MGRGKSRHYRDESDPLLGVYSQTLSDSLSTRNNPLYSSSIRYSYVQDPTSGNYSQQHQQQQQQQHQQQQHPLSPLKATLDAPFRGGFPSSDEKTNSPETTSGTNMDASGSNVSGVSASIRKATKKAAGYRVHRVSYTAQNHVEVLFQMYGSAFPNVLPFVLVNVLWTFIVHHMKTRQIMDWTFHSSIGHSFMGLLVSFLIVSRSKISYDRFMQYRDHLATTYRACREIAQLTSVYTYQTQTPQAQLWRRNVCFRTIVLLRVTMDALLWSSTEREKWEEEYFHLQENEIVDEEEEDGASVSDHFLRFRDLSHGRRSMIDENFRAPITFAHILKQTIMEHPDALGYKMAVNEYRDLINFVTIFTDAFHKFRVLIFTPYPFPLVQMTRAFLFFWVYTLPLVLLKEYRLWSSVLIVILVSFGFIGIEYVSMALDDPFGDDTNDVDEHGMALLVYEDIYLSIYRTDGPEAAFQLRERVLARYRQGRGLDCYRDDLKGYDVWEPAHLRNKIIQQHPLLAGSRPPRPNHNDGYGDPEKNV